MFTIGNFLVIPEMVFVKGGWFLSRHGSCLNSFAAVKIESGAKSALDPNRPLTIAPYVDDDIETLDLNIPDVTYSRLRRRVLPCSFPGVLQDRLGHDPAREVHWSPHG